MTQPVSGTTALPCVGIHLDDLVLAGALPAPLAGAQQLPALPGRFAPGRPPLSDEVDEEGAQDAGDDDEDEDDEDDEDEEEERGRGRRRRRGEEEEEEGEEDDDDDDDDDEKTTKKKTKKKKKKRKNDAYSRGDLLPPRVN